MKLEVGMYVRFDRNQGIRKIEEYDEDIKRYYLDDDIYDAWGDATCSIEDEKDILKASYNIIDLIEVGDYVNGKKVIKIWEEPFGEFAGQIFTILDGEEAAPTIREIKSIVTKEQFESMGYKI